MVAGARNVGAGAYYTVFSTHFLRISAVEHSTVHHLRCGTAVSNALTLPKPCSCIVECQHVRGATVHHPNGAHKVYSQYGYRTTKGLITSARLLQNKWG